MLKGHKDRLAQWQQAKATFRSELDKKYGEDAHKFAPYSMLHDGTPSLEVEHLDFPEEDSVEAFYRRNFIAACDGKEIK
jgi:hypothetical protein